MRWISSLSLVLLAPTPYAHAADFCDTRARGSLSATIDRLSGDPEMRLAFQNAGGILHGGVCWWHSRFQRAAWYLASFDPAAPAPSREEAKAIIGKLVARNEVVEIPGYRDLAAFSKDYQAEIQAALNAWQIRDAVINQAYIRGLSGKSHYRRADEMRARMNRVFVEFNAAKSKGDVLWLMLQMRGIVSHASLLRSMDRMGDGGYRLEVVDSNFPDRLVEYVYRPGDLELNPANVKAGEYSSVPYAGFSRDLGRIHEAIVRYCGETPGPIASR